MATNNKKKKPFTKSSSKRFHSLIISPHSNRLYTTTSAVIIAYRPGNLLPVVVNLRESRGSICSNYAEGCHKICERREGEVSSVYRVAYNRCLPRGISRRLTVAWLISGGGLARPKMTLNLDAGNGTGNGGNSGQLPPKKPGGLSLGLPLEINTARGSADLVDVGLPLERQGCVLVSRIIFALCLFFANPSGERFCWTRIKF